MGEASGGDKAPASDLRKDLIDDDIDMSENKKDNCDSSNSSGKKIKYDIEYTYMDRGPFEVYMQSADKNVGNYNFLSLAKLIYELNVEDIKKIHRKGKNRISIEFKNIKAANSFLKNKTLTEKGFDLFIPTNNVTSRGIVRLIDTSFSQEDLKKYSTTNKSNCKILNIRRLNRKCSIDNEIKYVPTSTVCYTFTGKSLPKDILICGISFPVIPYIMPVVQCFNCFLYGHVKVQCRGKSKCDKCGEIEHGDDTECTLKCYHCNNSHKSSSKNCPEYIRQKKIKEVMSLENLSFFDANEKIPKISNKRNKEFIQRPGDFPVLSNLQNEEFIPVERRREMVNNLTPFTFQSSYSTIVSKKRKPSSQVGGYDKFSHDQCLNSPNGRPEEGEGTYFIPDTPSGSRDGGREMSVYRDMMNIYKRLNMKDKEKSIEFMTKLVTNPETILPFGILPQTSEGIIKQFKFNG